MARTITLTAVCGITFGLLAMAPVRQVLALENQAVSIVGKDQILGSAEIASLPPAPAAMAMARFTFDPGAGLLTFEVPGPEILVLESGALNVDLRGETEDAGDVDEFRELLAPANPGRDQFSSPIHGVFRFALMPGDRLLVPADTPHRIENVSSEPAVLLAVAVTPLAPTKPAQAWPPAGISQPIPGVGITIQPMSVGYDVATLSLAGDSTLSVERLMLSPGRSTQTVTFANPELWYVEQGSIKIETTTGDATISKPATSWSQSKEHPAVAGALKYLVAGDAIRIEAGSEIIFSSAGSGPVVVTAMKVAAHGKVSAP